MYPGEATSYKAQIPPYFENIIILSRNYKKALYGADMNAQRYIDVITRNTFDMGKCGMTWISYISDYAII